MRKGQKMSTATKAKIRVARLRTAKAIKTLPIKQSVTPGKRKRGKSFSAAHRRKLSQAAKRRYGKVKPDKGIWKPIDLPFTISKMAKPLPPGDYSCHINDKGTVVIDSLSSLGEAVINQAVNRPQQDPRTLEERELEHARNQFVHYTTRRERILSELQTLNDEHERNNVECDIAHRQLQKALRELADAATKT